MLNRKNICATKELNKVICLFSLFLFLSMPAKAQNQGYNYYANYQNPSSFVSLATSFVNPQVPAYQYAYGARPLPYNGNYYINPGYYNSYSYSRKNKKSHPFLSLAASLVTSYYNNSSSYNPNYAYNSNYASPSIANPQTSVNGYILPNTNTGFYPNSNTTINNNRW